MLTLTNLFVVVCLFMPTATQVVQPGRCPRVRSQPRFNINRVSSCSFFLFFYYYFSWISWLSHQCDSHYSESLTGVTDSTWTLVSGNVKQRAGSPTPYDVVLFVFSELYNPAHGEVYSIQPYVIKIVSDLR
jgi:hypothetical protein